MTHACKRLSKKLRQEEGCDIVIALTHSGFVQVSIYPSTLDTDIVSPIHRLDRVILILSITREQL